MLYFYSRRGGGRYKLKELHEYFDFYAPGIDDSTDLAMVHTDENIDEVRMGYVLNKKVPEMLMGDDSCWHVLRTRFNRSKRIFTCLYGQKCRSPKTPPAYALVKFRLVRGQGLGNCDVETVAFRKFTNTEMFPTANEQSMWQTASQYRCPREEASFDHSRQKNTSVYKA